jgi:predicted AAA+ superfamily ATPase
VLDKRLSTIPNFQRTRGALRLLARAVRHLWDERPEGVQLIHLHYLDLGDSVIAEELSSRLERPQYEPVIRADVASQPGGRIRMLSGSMSRWVAASPVAWRQPSTCIP